MCGIYGLVFSNGKTIKPEMLQHFGDKMIHRGPDDSGYFINKSCGIGMRRLSIIDLAGGHQPISDPEGNIQVVLNGEIYNYKEIREDLITKGCKFRTQSDVETLVYLYKVYGRQGIHKLNGMFSFALYDKEKKHLWIARDRLGIKPLYYYHKNKSFGFSSDLNAIASYFGSELCEQSIVDYLGYSYVPAPNSIYKDIYKLLPGEEIVLSIEDLNYKLRSYWSLSEFETSSVTIEEAENTLSDLIADSIRLQMISDVPLGVFLSGGVDSSAIASYASEVNGSIPLETYTINFDGKEGRDSHFARSISKSIDSNHHEYNFTSNDQLEALDKLIPYMDEPMSDSAIVPTFMLSSKARKNGIKVLLSGAGGDEIFGGYPRHFPGKYFSSSWFSNLPYPLRKISSILLGLYNPSLIERISNPSRNFAVNISGTSFPFLFDILKSKENYKNLLNKIDKDFDQAANKSAYPLMNMDLKNYLPNNVLALTDKASMAASLEARVPLLDHRIVKFAFSLPANINLLNGKEKGLFCKSLEGRLPNQLLNREKEGFNAPVHQWVESWPEIFRDELLGKTSKYISNVIEIKSLERWLSQKKYRRQTGTTLYALFVLNKWLKKVGQ